MMAYFRTRSGQVVNTKTVSKKTLSEYGRRGAEAANKNRNAKSYIEDLEIKTYCPRCFEKLSFFKLDDEYSDVFCSMCGFDRGESETEDCIALGLHSKDERF